MILEGEGKGKSPHVINLIPQVSLHFTHITALPVCSYMYDNVTFKFFGPEGHKFVQAD